MSTALALAGTPATAIQISREWETDENLALIRQTVAPGLTQPEFMLFCHVARVRHLDPLQRQIHAVKRNSYDKDANGGKGGYVEKMTIQTGIDGFRAIANRTGLYMPSDKLPLVENLNKENMCVTVWVKKYHPQSGQWHEFGATALYKEFVQLKKDNNKMVPVAMWEKMPLGQTEKCAEAKALRRGWPEELGQMYVDEEMQQADSFSQIPPEPGNNTGKVQDKTQTAIGTLKPSSEPNRGHGNEGLQKTGNEPVLCGECRVTNGHSDDCKYNPKNQEKGKRKSSREAWESAEGWDPQVHISFDQGVTLFKMQKDLKLSEDEVKNRLREKLQIEHRKFIKQDDFELAKDAIDPEYKLHAAPSPDEDPEEMEDPEAGE